MYAGHDFSRWSCGTPPPSLLKKGHWNTSLLPLNLMLITDLEIRSLWNSINPHTHTHTFFIVYWKKFVCVEDKILKNLICFIIFYLNNFIACIIPNWFFVCYNTFDLAVNLCSLKIYSRKKTILELFNYVLSAKKLQAPLNTLLASGMIMSVFIVTNLLSIF